MFLWFPRPNLFFISKSGSSSVFPFIPSTDWSFFFKDPSWGRAEQVPRLLNRQLLRRRWSWNRWSHGIVAWGRDRGGGSRQRSETHWRKRGCGLEHSIRPRMLLEPTTPPLAPSVAPKQKPTSLSPLHLSTTTTPPIPSSITTASTPPPTTTAVFKTSTLLTRRDPPPAVWAAPSSHSAAHVLPLPWLRRRRWRRRQPGGTHELRL